MLQINPNYTAIAKKKQNKQKKPQTQSFAILLLYEDRMLSNMHTSNLI